MRAEFQSKSISVFEAVPALNEMSAFNFFVSLCRKLPMVFFSFNTAITETNHCFQTSEIIGSSALGFV